MRARFLEIRFHLAAVAAVVVAGGVMRAQEKGAEPLTTIDAEGMAYIDEVMARILKAERKRAKLLFMETQAKGLVLAFAIPQPTPAEIEVSMAPLEDFIAIAKSRRSVGWAKDRIAGLSRSFGFGEGKMRAVYILIPDNREELLLRASFPAKTRAECEEFIREDVKPVKREIGKPYQDRAGTRSAYRQINSGWSGEELVKGYDLETKLENWVNWYAKRKHVK